MAQAFQKLGRYLIVGEIAQGGMANIYRGKLVGVEGFEKDVAIKKILSYWSHQKEFVDMLIDEAKILVHLSHNNIVQVIELGKESDHYFIVMEYVAGLDLKKTIRKLTAEKQTLPLEIACYITRQICLGLEFAHSRLNQRGEPLNIVHRDISPQNILISTEGDVKITDFGIAKVIGKTSETATGVLKGKFSYMSPEQAIGQDIDLRTDIFALGALLYEMIVGEKAFEGRNDFEIIEKVKNARFTLPEDINPGMKRIISKTLEREPQKRYQSAFELRRDIEAFEKNLHINCDSSLLKDYLIQNFSNELARKDISIEGFFVQTRIETNSESGNENITCLIPEPGNSQVIVDKNTSISKRSLIEEIVPESNSDLASAITPEEKMPEREGTFVEQKTVIETLPQKISAHFDTEKPQILQVLKTASKTHRFPLREVMAIALVLFTITMTWTAWNKSSETEMPASLTPNALASPHLLDHNPMEPALPANKSAGDKSVFAKMTVPKTSLMANISITAEPSAARIEVLLGGQTLTSNGNFESGTTLDAKKNKIIIPVKVSLEGYETHTFELVLDAQNLSSSKSVALKALKYGTIRITARPWGYASVRGIESKSVPASLKIPVGEQIVSVFHPPTHKSVSKRVVVSENGIINCQATFGGVSDYMVCR